MKIVAVSDLYVPAEAMETGLSGLAPSELVTIEWDAVDVAELHHRIRELERSGPDAFPPPQELRSHIRDARIVVTHFCPISAALIREADRLRVIGVCRVGTENIDVQAAEARHIKVINVPSRNAVAVAEFTVGLILAERRNIARAHLSLATGGWRKVFANDGQPTQLQDKTVGVVGFGVIGQMVAERLRPFGVHLLVHDPFQPSEVVDRHGARVVGLDELLKQADVISLHARCADDQVPLIGSRELSLMRPSAYLINTARAYLLDADALAVALREQRIAGAAVDVFEWEPLDANSPLRKLDNITLTPHLAGSTVEAFHGCPRLLAERIRQELEDVTP